MEEGKVMAKRRDFTVHTSFPTDIEKHYVNILTPAQRLTALVEAGRKHQDQLLKQEETMKRISDNITRVNQETLTRLPKGYPNATIENVAIYDRALTPKDVEKKVKEEE